MKADRVHGTYLDVLVEPVPAESWRGRLVGGGGVVYGAALAVLSLRPTLCALLPERFMTLALDGMDILALDGIHWPHAEIKSVRRGPAHVTFPQNKRFLQYPLKGVNGFTERVLPPLGACERFIFGVDAVPKSSARDVLVRF